MDIGKLSYYSRRLHRLSLWFVVISGLVQMVTGLALKYPQLTFFNQGSVRLLHFQTASWFTIAFGIQLTTGMVMYFIPMIIKYKQKKTGSKSSVSSGIKPLQLFIARTGVGSKKITA